MRLPVLAAAIVLAGLCSVAATAKTPNLPPPYQGAYQPQGVDEVGHWREDDESERKLAASALIIRDEKLTAYVKKVLCSAVGDDRCNSVRVYILREPTFNASMSPNGTMRIFSGLFLRVHNEAELAAVLGHEFGHFERRHTVEAFKAARRGIDILTWSALLVSMAPGYNNRRTYQNLELSIYGGLYRHSRDQEREADRLGIAYLNKSQLRPQAASKVWQDIMAELDASVRVRGLKKPNFNAIAFTASHPPDAERAAYLAELALPEAETRDDGADRYREALASWLASFLEDQIKLNDFGASEYLIQSIAETGWTADLWFARGELYRTRGNQRDLANAAGFYTQAIALNADMANAYRGLGLSLLKTGQPTEGQKALRRYLELKPDASDASMIRMMIPKEVAGS